MIGSALTPFLQRDGHEVVKLQRGRERPDPHLPSWEPADRKISLAGAGPFDAVIHLAGETIAQRWTATSKARIRDSRVKGTEFLSAFLAGLAERPKVFIAASAIGFYGNRGDEVVAEDSAPGSGFLAEVCKEWEDATRPASESGIRVVNLRLGIVLDSRGGALGKMLRPFRAGLGGRLGSGRQYWSWIAIDDLLAVFRRALIDSSLRGPVNAVSPHPVTNAEFTHTLGLVLRRPTFFNVPAFGVKLLFGEMGETALLASTRVRPARLEQIGFVFQFPKLEAALRHMLRPRE